MHDTMCLCLSKGIRALAAVFMAIVLCVALSPLGASKAQADAATNAMLSYSASKLHKGRQESGACLCYCYSYASTIAIGMSYSPAKFKQNPKSDSWSAKNMSGGDSGEYTYSGAKFSSGSKATQAEELKYVYDKVTTGHPVILYVSTSSGGQHWVVIVGVKNAKRSNLSLDNFLMLDSASIASGKNVAPTPITVSSKKYTLRAGNNNVRVANDKVKLTAGSSVLMVKQAKPTISSATYPTKLSYGTGFMPKGTVKAESEIIKMQGSISDASGAALQTVTVKPNKTTAKIQTRYSGKKIQGSLVFSKLKPGTYTYAVRVWTEDASCYVLKKTFTVYSPKAKISGADKIAATSFRVKWGKVSGSTGYQVRYSTSSSFASCKKKALSSSARSCVLSGLSSSTKYYVQVRSYKKTSGKKYYATWSNVKKVTTAAAPKLSSAKSASKTAGSTK